MNKKMKKINFEYAVKRLAVVWLVVSMAACGGSGTKDSNDALKGLVKSLKETAAENENSAVTDAENEKEQPAETTNEMVETQPEGEKEDPKRWIEGDFKVEYEEKMPTFSGISDMTEYTKVVRHGDVVYVYKRNQAAAVNRLYCVEDGKVVAYLFNPSNKKAKKDPVKSADLNSVLRSLFRDNVLDFSKLATMEKTGTETVAGLSCNVLEKSVDKSKEAAGLEALAKLIDKDGKNAEEIKKISDMNGSAKVWVDAQNRLVIRRSATINMGGKKSSGDLLKVTFIRIGSSDPDEVAFDMSQYAMQ
ncbi:MAG TPA: hypothetical protein DEQ30_13115 [Porphyromonadaceae bacterium]|nr:hypothetical protein [Porphyromonadaceae bacterium]